MNIWVILAQVNLLNKIQFSCQYTMVHVLSSGSKLKFPRTYVYTLKMRAFNTLEHFSFYDNVFQLNFRSQCRSDRSWGCPGIFGRKCATKLQGFFRRNNDSSGPGLGKGSGSIFREIRHYFRGWHHLHWGDIPQFVEHDETLSAARVGVVFGLQGSVWAWRKVLGSDATKFRSDDSSSGFRQRHHCLLRTETTAWGIMTNKISLGLHYLPKVEKKL